MHQANVFCGLYEFIILNIMSTDNHSEVRAYEAPEISIIKLLNQAIICGSEEQIDPINPGIGGED